MNREAITYLKSVFESGKLEHDIPSYKGVPYKALLVEPNSEMGFNIPYIMIIPMCPNINNQLVVESNNKESNLQDVVLEQGIETALKLVGRTRGKPSPVVVPLIPSLSPNSPYFQQLSVECFSVPIEDPLYRIDEQVKNIINHSKMVAEEITGVEMRDKVFLNGYSSSGVFAQRFSLLHPEIVETACIGGASGSIPVVSKDLPYPLGLMDYEALTGSEFDYKNYLNISFTYYVGELEDYRKFPTRFDEANNNAPMHDMSYFERSVPEDAGYMQRQMLGYNLLERAENTVAYLQDCGITINHTIIPGRAHNNIEGTDIKGVNEEGDSIVETTYLNSLLKSDDKQQN